MPKPTPWKSISNRCDQFNWIFCSMQYAVHTMLCISILYYALPNIALVISKQHLPRTESVSICISSIFVPNFRFIFDTERLQRIFQSNFPLDNWTTIYSHLKTWLCLCLSFVIDRCVAQSSHRCRPSGRAPLHSQCSNLWEYRDSESHPRSRISNLLLCWACWVWIVQTTCRLRDRERNNMNWMKMFGKWNSVEESDFRPSNAHSSLSLCDSPVSRCRSKWNSTSLAENDKKIKTQWCDRPKRKHN